MWQRIKCFFGRHEWDKIEVDWDSNNPPLFYYCKHCPAREFIQCCE